MGAGKFDGSWASNRVKASSPPAEVPITMIDATIELRLQYSTIES